MKTVNEIKQEMELVEIVKSALDINGQVACQLIKKWTQDDSIKYTSGGLLKSNLDNYVTLSQIETVLSKDDTAKLLEVTDKIISSLNSMKKIPNLNLDEIVSNNKKENNTFYLGNPVGKELIIRPTGEVTVVDETEAETQLRELPSVASVLSAKETEEYFKLLKESKFDINSIPLRILTKVNGETSNKEINSILSTIKSIENTGFYKTSDEGRELSRIEKILEDKITSDMVDENYKSLENNIRLLQRIKEGYKTRITETISAGVLSVRDISNVTI